MLGGMDSKNVNAMMRKMGIKTEQIPAKEVLIKGEKNLVIKNPQVTMMIVQGQKTFQILGDVQETAAESFSEEDVKMVAEQTGKSKEEAKAALEATEGDLAEAISNLS